MAGITKIKKYLIKTTMNAFEVNEYEATYNMGTKVWEKHPFYTLIPFSQVLRAFIHEGYVHVISANNHYRVVNDSGQMERFKDWLNK